MNSEIKTRLQVNSSILLKKITQYLIDNADIQMAGRAGNLGIVEVIGNEFYSYLEPFAMVQVVSYRLNQSIQASCQYGDVGLVNEDGTANSDVPTKFGKKCWANGYISTRLSDFSRSF